MEAGIPQDTQDWDFWKQGLDRRFVGKVYWRATQISVVAALMFLGFEQKTVAVGLLAGAAIGLFSLWTCEATVKLLFNGGRGAGLKLALAGMLKLPFILAALGLVAWSADRGLLNIFALVVGTLVVHGTMLVMVIATAMAHQDRISERYR
ncbi:MAG: hypothetical protein ACK47B_04430 [Armatimonadota bacterium]